jgi:hypothetical protein
VAKEGRADALLIAALAAGATQDQAARQSGLAPRTIRHRLADPAFRTRVEQARKEMLATAVARLTAASTAAATTLLNLLEAESESVQLGAARAILDLGTKMREAGELEERLARLEERMNTAADRRERWEASASA